MVRAPCCEKMGLKKGPWTIEEDHILINYVTKYGHGNWRALPRQAGLLRCGKSCRLRWVNYLRPDIKRGNFDIQEQEAIIELHELLGNRWSAIAARLPGRTDNEIKNVWHTHLKKRARQNKIIKEINPVHQYSNANPQINSDELKDQDPKAMSSSSEIIRLESPQHSGITDSSSSSIDHDVLENYFPEVDADFWSEMFPVENANTTSDFLNRADPQMLFQFSPMNVEEFLCDYNSSMIDSTDFSFSQSELPEFYHQKK